MSESPERLRHKIEEASDLESVVRTMKVMAASNITQYENAVQALGVYFRTIELGLIASLSNQIRDGYHLLDTRKITNFNALVFGSDQGLVGQFNDLMLDFVIKSFEDLPGERQVWAVGERISTRLTDAGIKVEGIYSVPNALNAVTYLVGQILIDNGDTPLYIYHHQPKTDTTYEPVVQRLLPLDKKWIEDFAKRPWPTNLPPEVLGANEPMLKALIDEYLFVSLFKACVESLACENSSRLAAMQRAEKNINELLADLNQYYHRVRQNTIDEELFDVISGFEAMSNKKLS